jgi:hypothetical protein
MYDLNLKKIKRLRKRNNRRVREKNEKINQLLSKQLKEQLKMEELKEQLKREEQAKTNHNNLLSLLDCIKSKIMNDKGHNKQMYINVYNKYEKRYLGINRNSLYKKAPANNYELVEDTNLDFSTPYILRHLSDLYKFPPQI